MSIGKAEVATFAAGTALSAAYGAYRGYASAKAEHVPNVPVLLNPNIKNNRSRHFSKRQSILEPVASPYDHVGEYFTLRPVSNAATFGNPANNSTLYIADPQGSGTNKWGVDSGNSAGQLVGQVGPSLVSGDYLFYVPIPGLWEVEFSVNIDTVSGVGASDWVNPHLVLSTGAPTNGYAQPYSLYNDGTDDVSVDSLVAYGPTAARNCALKGTVYYLTQGNPQTLGWAVKMPYLYVNNSQSGVFAISLRSIGSWIKVSLANPYTTSIYTFPGVLSGTHPSQQKVQIEEVNGDPSEKASSSSKGKTPAVAPAVASPNGGLSDFEEMAPEDDLMPMSAVQDRPLVVHKGSLDMFQDGIESLMHQGATLADLENLLKSVGKLQAKSASRGPK